MAEAFFSATNYPLSLLIQNIEAGEIALSGIQRPFVWPNSRVRDLFDSMYRGFPVGHLLFAPYEGWHTTSGRGTPRLLIVDGQQRLTSLFSILKGSKVMREDFREEKIEIAFRPADCRFEVADAAVRKDPEFIPDVGPLVSGRVSQYRYVREYLERLRTHRIVDDAEEGRISSAIYRLCDLQSYPFTVLQLSRSLDEEQVAEIFVRINSRGVPLGVADFILTMMAVAWEDGRRHLELFCRETREQPTAGTKSPANPLLHPTPDQILRIVGALSFRRARLGQIYSVLQGLDPDTRQPALEKREARFDRLREAQSVVLDPANWQNFLEAARAAGYLNASMVSSPMGLLYCYVVFLIGKMDFDIEDSALRDITARWISFALLTSRYSSAGESTLDLDMARLGEARSGGSFVSALKETMATHLTDGYWTITLPDALETTSPRSPAALGFCAALCALGQSALLSESGLSAYFEGRRDLVERRYLFPRKQIGQAGSTKGNEANQVANLVYVATASKEWTSSRELAARLARDAGSGALEDQRLHALPVGWGAMKYGEFLRARRMAMAQVMRQIIAEQPSRQAQTSIPLRAG